MTDAARDEVVEEACRGLEWHGSVETAEQLRMTFDALSARLAQECALRAQAEQERDGAIAALDRETHALHEEIETLRARLRVADALLREYEEALTYVNTNETLSKEARRRIRIVLTSGTAQ